MRVTSDLIDVNVFARVIATRTRAISREINFEEMHERKVSVRVMEQ